MQRIESTDACCVCMDDTNRDFLYKTCCAVLLCRQCYNQLEVEAFPNHSTCPGCRQPFHKVGYSVDVVNQIAVPRAYCGLPLPEVQSLKEHDAHVLSCVECLKKVIKGNNWFEKQLTEKFAGIKRKLQTTEDEVYVRNQRIRELTLQNAAMASEYARQTVVFQQIIHNTATARRGPSARRELFPADENQESESSVSSTEVFSVNEDEGPSTPPRQTISASRTSPPPAPRPRRVTRNTAPRNARRALQIALDDNNTTL